MPGQTLTVDVVITWSACHQDASQIVYFQIFDCLFEEFKRPEDVEVRYVERKKQTFEKSQKNRNIFYLIPLIRL